VAAAWLAAFKVFPWREALALAPTIVQAARALWNTVRTDESTNAAPSTEAASDNETRLRALEARVAEIASEAISSAELVKSLAEQNAELVQAVEILRIRTRGLLGATALTWLMMLALLSAVIAQ
jgi:hypothetical protein